MGPTKKQGIRKEPSKRVVHLVNASLTLGEKVFPKFNKNVIIYIYRLKQKFE